MKVLMYEPTGGFWPYTPELVSSLAELNLDIAFVSSKSRCQYYFGKSNIKFLPHARVMDGRISRKLFPIWASERLLSIVQWGNLRNRMVQEYKPDILHLQSAAAIIDQYRLSRLKKYTKIILTVHDVLPITNSVQNRSASALKKIYDIADVLIVHSASNKKELINFFNIECSKITIIPHGVSPVDKIIEKSLARKKLNLIPDSKYILLFGGLRQSKGLDLALKILSNLKKSGDSCKLIIAGKPAQDDFNFDQLHKLSIDLDIADDVIWRLGYVPDEEVAAYFCASDIVLLPYVKFHSQSGVLFQAYRYNVPVVVTDTGSLGETVKSDGTGEIIKSHFKIENFSESILRLLYDKNYYEQCKERQKRSIYEKYNWKVVAKSTYDLYKTVLK